MSKIIPASPRKTDWNPLPNFTASLQGITNAANDMVDALMQVQHGFKGVRAMADVNLGLREAIRRTRGTRTLPEPYCDIRVILSDGRAYDDKDRYLLTLDPAGIDEVFTRLDNIEIKTALGDATCIRAKFTLLTTKNRASA